MKKTVLTALTLAFLFVVSVKTVSAQTFNFDKAYQDYQYSLSIYQQAYTDYQDARDFYTKNQTLTLKEDARVKTLAMLRARDQLEIVYLTALRMDIVETTGLSDATRNDIFGKIDTEVAWYQAHKGSYQDGDELTTLFKESDGAQNQYDTSTQLVIYTALFDISEGQLAGLRADHENVYSSLKDFIQTQVSAGTMKIDPFNRWFNDIDSSITQLKTNENAGIIQIQKIYQGNYQVPQSAYNSGINAISESPTLLTQLNGFLVELITAVRNEMAKTN